MVPDSEALSLVSESFARSNLVVPISLEGNTLRVAVVDPDNILLIDRIRQHVGLPDVKIEPLAAGKRDIQEALDKYYGYALSIDEILHELETGEVDVRALTEGEDYAHPLVRLVDAILTDAVKQEASDIHIEPEEKFIRIRYRIDGVLRQIRILHRSLWSGMVVRMKVLADLDLTESRRPQDGRLELMVHGRRIFFRISTLPTLYGENFVLRILDRDKSIVPLDKLGLDPKNYQDIQFMISRPHGIMLVTGPTGSGKTTTLYSILNEQNEIGTNIMTLEDPVEYPIQLIRQTQVNEEVGMTFASGIRALLRQDPDVILIGEIRDGETAEMAFRAAMTGHQVFATLHTNTALGAISRLKDIGITPSVMSGNIIGIVGQRLARRLCSHCKEAYDPSPMERQVLRIPQDRPFKLYRPKGCLHCNHSGYRGRVAVLETLRMSKALDDLIMAEASLQEMERVAVREGFRPMLVSALAWVRRGKTTFEEASRVVDMSAILDLLAQEKQEERAGHG